MTETEPTDEPTATRSWRSRYANTGRYALFGALFGLCFPLGATLLDLLVQGVALDWAGVTDVQARQPLHWIIDTAPLFLGLFASLAGRRQDRLQTVVFHLRREQARSEMLSRFPDENPDPVLRISQDCRVLYANRRGQELLQGLLAEGVLPDSWRSVTTEALADGGGREVEVPLGERVVSLHFAPVVDSGYVNVYGRDITDRLAAQGRLEQAVQAAERANRAKSEFLAQMSHELRTPLNAILGYGQILATAPDLAAEHRRSVDNISLSGEHLLGLINDILDLSRIESGEGRLNPSDFRLSRLVRGLASMFELRCEQRGLRWSARCEVTQDAAFGDEGKLRQVLINLLGNAIKFTDAGAVTLEVTQEEDGAYHFSVTDTGTGIAAERQAEVFEPFRQEEEGVRRGGTGLGLSISSRQVALLGGRLEVESAPGKGSRFFFTVPLQPGHAADAVTTIETDWKRVCGLRRPASLHALVVDDVLTNRDIIRRMLETAGIRVDAVDSGEAALAAVRQERPDVVFMDIRMGGMDGVEAMQRLFAEHGREALKIVAVTASVLDHERRAHEEAGFDAFLSKPLRAQDLYACLQRLFDAEFEVTPDAAAVVETADEWRQASLPAVVHAALLAAAESQNVSELRRQIETLKGGDAAPAPLLRRLVRQSQRFDLAGIRETLQQVTAV